LRNARNPQTGERSYTPLVAISLLVFFVLALQCTSTLAIAKRELNSWKWPLFMWVYMTGLAYIAAFIVYQGGLALGFG
jgi:ferrous iron transport protein B